MKRKPPFLQRCFAMWGLVFGMAVGSYWFGLVTVAEAIWVWLAFSAAYPLYAIALDKIDDAAERNGL